MCVYICVCVCTHVYEIKRFPGVQYNSNKQSKFTNTVSFALKFRTPKLSGRMSPECQIFAELITGRATRCKIQIDLQKHTCTHSEFEKPSCRAISYIYLQHEKRKILRVWGSFYSVVFCCLVLVLFSSTDFYIINSGLECLHCRCPLMLNKQSWLNKGFENENLGLQRKTSSFCLFSSPFL